MLHARELNPDVRFLTAADIPNRYVELFKQLNLRIKYYPPGSVLIGHPLVLVDQPDLFWPRKADLSVLRQTLGESDEQPVRNIYFPRGSYFRSPVGEDCLLEEMTKAGFEIVELHRYSICDQWAIGRNARVVAGSHGASLWVTAAMVRGTTVLEVTSGHLFEQCYRRISHQAHLRYCLIQSQGSASSPFGQALNPSELSRIALEVNGAN